MNGLVVMDCVQTAYHGQYGLYGARDKMIRISGRRAVSGTRVRGDSEAQKAGRRAAGLNYNDYNETVSSSPVSACGDSKKAAARVQGSIRKEESGQKKHSSAAGISALRILALALILSGSIAGFQMITGAHSRPEQKAWKYHTAVTIPCGETFEDIVDRYCSSTYYDSREDYVREVCEINALPCKKGEMPDLQAGTTLVVPYYSTEYK